MVGGIRGSGWYTVSIKHNDDKRVEGHFQSNDEADKKSGRYYDLAFALDLPGAPDRQEDPWHSSPTLSPTGRGRTRPGRGPQ